MVDIVGKKFQLSKALAAIRHITIECGVQE